MEKIATKEIKDIVNELVKHLQPKSIYIYGSWIRVDSKKDSDIDILLVVDKDRLNFNYLRNFSEKHKFLDLTILTEDEIKNGAHASFNSFYFINLLFSSIHVYGEDILLKEFTKFPDFDSSLRRLQCILQRMRNVLSNKSKSHEEFYWFKKSSHWLYPIISEFLFFTKGYYNPNLLQTKNKFEEMFFKLIINNLKDLYDVFSKIKKMYLNHRYQNIRIRPGIFVLIRDKIGKYLLLERADGRGFEFVKGGIELGESFKDAVFREVKEEIGIKISPRELIELPVTLSFRFPLKEGYEIRIYKGFLIVMDKIDVKALVLDKFFSSAKLMRLNKASKLISFPEYYKTLKEVDELLKKKFGLIMNVNRIRWEIKDKKDLANKKVVKN